MDFKLLEKLVNTYSPTSDEENRIQIIKNEIEDSVDDILIDNLGNLIAHKKGNGKKMLICSNVDDKTLMISYKEGTKLSFCNLNNLDESTLIGKHVLFDKNITGIICKEDKDIFVTLDDDKKNDEIDVGSLFVIDPKLVTGKNTVSFDIENPSISCYTLVEIIKENIKSEYDLYYAFNVKGNSGFNGTIASTYRVEPDIALDIDLISAKNDSGVYIMQNDGRCVANDDLVDKLINNAKDNNIKYQIGVLGRVRRAISFMTVTKSGVIASGAHIPFETKDKSVSIHKDDINECRKFLVNFIDGVK